MNYRWTNILLVLTEQVDQQITWSREDLDQMSCVYICPTSMVRTLRPANGSQHIEFTGMTVQTSNASRMAAGLSRLTVNYLGKIDIRGEQTYVSDTRIDSTWTEGEVSYSQTQVQEEIIEAGGRGIVYNIVKASISERYTGMGCSIKYVTNKRPSAGLFGRLAAPYLGFTNKVIVQTGLQILASGTGLAGSLPPSQSPPTEQMSLVNLGISDRFGWYQVTEDYTSKMFPGALV